MSPTRNDPPGLPGALRGALRAPLGPGRRPWLSFAWACVVLLVVLGLSGVLLSIYYLPAIDAAAESVRFVMRDVEWGWLVRGVHRWAATVLIACALAQLAWTLLSGRYRGAGAGSWVLGCLMLLLVLGLAFTGELLPWDAESVALARSALAGTQAIPVVGAPLAGAMRGGAEVGAATLARAHAAHTLVLPWLVFLLLVLELWFLARLRALRRGRA